jgi:pimeloyl-ACP methyl ester carboxylesterase
MSSVGFLRYVGAAFFSGLLAAGCAPGGGGATPVPAAPPEPSGSGFVDLTCPDPVPRAVLNSSDIEPIVVNVPSDLDISANPAPTTTIAATVFLPERCPGETFPLIVHSHGWSGSRLTTLDDDGEVEPNSAHFASISALASALPFHNYVVISFDERGHGESKNANARVIDPEAETQDAIALLDWVAKHATAGDLPVRIDPVTQDMPVGLLGLSYGGGFQFPLAALDPRVDVMVPNGTWHDLQYALVPNDAVKSGFDSLLCLTGTLSSLALTPLLQNACNFLGPTLSGTTGLTSATIRTRQDLADAVSGPLASPRTVTEDELVGFFHGHGLGFFWERELLGLPWRTGEAKAFQQRPVDVLLIQGNRDALFNYTEGYWNYRYLSQAGGDVRFLSTEGGHMNPFAGQAEGSGNCGATEGVKSVRAFLDAKLKNQVSADFNNIPEVCISLTENSDRTGSVAVNLAAVPVGDQGGMPGGVAATLASGSASPLPVVGQVVGGLTGMETFVPVATITGDDAVLAGIPRIGRLAVTGTLEALVAPVAYIGVGIKRGMELILVDDQVTAFAGPGGSSANPEGIHTDNSPSDGIAGVLLPGVGEALQDGDVVGLILFENQVQYQPVVSVSTVTGLADSLLVAGLLSGVLDPLLCDTAGVCLALPPVGVPNGYTAEFEDVELPILRVGVYPGSSLSVRPVPAP